MNRLPRRSVDEAAVELVAWAVAKAAWLDDLWMQEE